MNGIPEAFAVRPQRMDDLLVITVTGELDAANVDLLDQAIREAEKEESEAIFLDLQRMSFIDSVGLGLLCDARRRCERIRFIPSDHDQVARLVALSGTEDVLGYPLLAEQRTEWGDAGAAFSSVPAFPLKVPCPK